ncbi:MAG: response regulator transcription factor [Acidobacteria bacterium]|nr:response regulator transcription factor [Acidobacteriota bacterium]
MTPIRVLVVDDESWARKRLTSLFKRTPDFQVVGECADGEEAANALLAASPDVVFLDVQMPGMNGFDALDAIEPARLPLVVFVTAYDKYAIQAFEIHAVDYLLKPFDEERFSKTLDRLRLELATKDSRPDTMSLRELLNGLRKARPYLRRLGAKSGGRIVFLRTEDVDWIGATDNYITLHVGMDEHLIRATMNGIEAKLDPEQFVRVHRSTIVNLDRVKELHPWFRGELVLVLKDGTRLAVGRNFRSRLRHLFENKPVS